MFDCHKEEEEHNDNPALKIGTQSVENLFFFPRLKTVIMMQNVVVVLFFFSASVLLLEMSAGGLNMHTCIHPPFGNVSGFWVILKYDPTLIYTNQTGCCCHLDYRTMRMDEMFSVNGNPKASCPNHYRCVCAGGRWGNIFRLPASYCCRLSVPLQTLPTL